MLFRRAPHLMIAAVGAFMLIGLYHSAAQAPPPEIVQAASKVTGATYGTPVTVVLTLTIAKGYHVQGNNAKDPYIPTTATVTAPSGVTIGKISYPPSVKKEFSGEKLPVYESKVEIKIPVTVSKTVKAGDLKLPVTVNYQGCNNKVCYPPANLKTTIDIKVSGGR